MIGHRLVKDISNAHTIYKIFLQINEEKDRQIRKVWRESNLLLISRGCKLQEKISNYTPKLNIKKGDSYFHQHLLRMFTVTLT